MGSDLEPHVCDLCSGDKILTKEPCQSCEQRGFHVHVMQDYEGDFTCEKCKGSGEIECECVQEGISDFPCIECHGEQCVRMGDSTECSVCHGSGNSLDSGTSEIEFSNWVQSELGKQVYEKFGTNCLDDMFELETLEVDDYHTINLILCPECKKTRKSHECRICNGTRVIKVIVNKYAPCSWCMGDGAFYDSDDFMECEHCCGIGFAGCVKCAGKIDIGCPDCTGAGIVRIIVSKPI